MADLIVTSTTPILDPIHGDEPTQGDITEWPWPQLLVSNNKLMALFKQQNGHLYAFEFFMDKSASWLGYVAGDLGLADEIDFVDMANFGRFYVLCVSGVDTRVFLRDPNITPENIDRDIVGINLITELSTPLMKTCCNYKQQFVGGNISNFLDCSMNSVLWSGIGNFSFNLEEIKSAGRTNLIPNRANGDLCQVYRVLAMQEAVIVYTNHGVLAFPDEIVGNSPTYGRVPLRGLGIVNSNHVAGDEYIHGYIDMNYDFCTIENTAFRTIGQEGGKVIKRGYREFIEPLFAYDTRVVVSYVPKNRTFYISNGLYSLVINDYGAFTCHQAVSSVVKAWDGRTYGTFRDYGDTEARITIDSTDFGDRSLKSIESVLLGASCLDGASVSASSLWRSKKSGEYVQGPWKPLNPRGEARLCLSGMDHKLRCRFSTYVESSLDSFIANVKFPDARFRRGVSTGGTNNASS